MRGQKFIYEHCEQGIQLTPRMVRRFAESILPELQERNNDVNNLTFVHFPHQVGLSHQVSTHVVQKILLNQR